MTPSMTATYPRSTAAEAHPRRRLPRLASLFGTGLLIALMLALHHPIMVAAMGQMQSSHAAATSVSASQSVHRGCSSPSTCITTMSAIHQCSLLEVARSDHPATIEPVSPSILAVRWTPVVHPHGPPPSQLTSLTRSSTRQAQLQIYLL